MTCEHNRRPTRCLDCARETFMGGALDPTEAVAQALHVELACRANYIQWLERQVRQLEDENARMDDKLDRLSKDLVTTLKVAA